VTAAGAATARRKKAAQEPAERGPEVWSTHIQRRQARKLRSSSRACDTHRVYYAADDDNFFADGSSSVAAADDV
jgi:hypothetical protein